MPPLDVPYKRGQLLSQQVLDATESGPRIAMTAEQVAALSPEQQKVYTAGAIDGFNRGREMKLVVEQQRMDALRTIEKILEVVDDPDQVRALGQYRLDAASAEMKALLT